MRTLKSFFVIIFSLFFFSCNNNSQDQEDVRPDTELQRDVQGDSQGNLSELPKGIQINKSSDNPDDSIFLRGNEEWAHYFDTDFHFSFDYRLYPSGYSLRTPKELDAGKIKSFFLMRKSDYEELQKAEVRREGPPTLNIDFIANPENLSVQDWIRENRLLSNYQDTLLEPAMIAGKETVKYSWSGLYEADVFVIEDSGNIIMLTGMYVADTEYPESDNIRTDFMDFINSLVFFNDVRTYTSDYLGDLVYTLRYPTAYTVEQEPIEPELGILSSRGQEVRILPPKTADFTSYISILQDPYDLSTKREVYKDWEETPIILNGMRAYQFEKSDLPNHLEVFIPTDSAMLLIITDTSNRPEIEATLNSFTLLRKADVNAENEIKHFSDEELGFSFEYPSKLGEVELLVMNPGGKRPSGITGEKLVGTFSHFGGLEIGGITDDFTAPREGLITDTRGFVEENGKYYFKFVSAKDASYKAYEIQPYKILEKDFGKIIIINDQSFDAERRAVEGPILGVGKDGLAGLVNLKGEKFPGVIFYKIGAAKFAFEEFEALLNSIQVYTPGSIEYSEITKTME